VQRGLQAVEDALSREETRLRDGGSTPDLDDRWIKNLRRLELMRSLLDRAYAALPRVTA